MGITCCAFNLGNIDLEVVGVNEGFGRGLFDQTDRFPPMQAPVQGSVNGAQLSAGIKQVQVLDAIPSQDRNPIALF